ncbi:MAG: fatty acid desaturase family protein [Methylocystis sp.]|uniref:fatty acid desaturase family protein n=1 Tax=Methylocystis sp. TaxID=1911079 RepID=UPI003DA2034B
MFPKPKGRAVRIDVEIDPVAPGLAALNRQEAPYRANVWLTALALTGAFFQIIVVPIFFLPQAPGLATLVVVMLSFGAPMSRALLHEAIHRRLARSSFWNDRLGRALAIIYGIAFDVMRFGHSAHHRFPRHAFDRADIIAVGEKRIVACLHYYCGLLGWFYVREILAGSIVLLPRRAIELLTDRALRTDDTLRVLVSAIRQSLDRSLQRCRLDLALAALLYGGAFYLYGACWPILLTGIVVRALITSLLDNVAHYGTPGETGAAAHNLWASHWLSLYVLNGNLHGVHHDRPEVPWNLLPQMHRQTHKGYAGGYMAFLVMQFLGPRVSFPLGTRSTGAKQENLISTTRPIT